MTDPTTESAPPRAPGREGWIAKAVLLGLLSLAALFFGLTWQIDSKALNAAMLVVDEHALDFGEIWERSDFTWEFPVKNVSQRTIEVAEFDLSCDCIKVEPHSFTLAPGEVRKCRARLKVVGLPGSAPSLAPRPFETPITPRIVGVTGIGQASWMVHGVVRPVALLKPSSLYFDQLSHEAGIPLREVVRATTAEPVATWSARCDQKMVSASATRSRTDPCAFDIVVTPQVATLPSGPFRTTVRLVALGSEGKELPPVELVVEGLVIDDIHAVPGTITFGANPLGEKGTETVILRSRTGLAFRVVKVENEGVDLTVQPQKSEDPAGRAFRFSRRFTQTGFQSGVVRFHVRSEGQPLIKIPVPWSYYGVGK